MQRKPVPIVTASKTNKSTQEAEAGGALGVQSRLQMKGSKERRGKEGGEREGGREREKKLNMLGFQHQMYARGHS